MSQQEELQKAMEGLFGSLPKQETPSPKLSKEEVDLVHKIMMDELVKLSNTNRIRTTEEITKLLYLKELLT